MPIDLPLNEITSDLCHDINNPLAIVCGTSQQLGRLFGEEPWDPVRAKTLLERIDRNLERITRLVHGLAILAKKTQNEMPKTIESQKLLESIVPFCEETLKKGKIEFRLTTQPEMPKLMCKTLALSQAILLIIRQACSVTNQLTERWIELDFSASASSWIISVKRPKVPQDEGLDLSQAPEFSFSNEVSRLHAGRLALKVADSGTTVIMELPVPSPTFAPTEPDKKGAGLAANS
jgi:signal transduction histidine kinase